ncbi:MAG: zf-TFIIB domain-containing protein [Planctomycetota bacterium]
MNNRSLTKRNTDINISGVANCPRCEKKSLMSALAGEARILRCYLCNGTWVPRGEAEALRDSFPGIGPFQKQQLDRLREAAAKRNLSDGVRYLACPECNNLMDRRQFALGSGIVVDRCLKHGVWFDGGEIELAAAYFAAGGPRKARLRELQRELKRSPAEGVPDALSPLAELLLWML